MNIIHMLILTALLLLAVLPFIGRTLRGAQNFANALIAERWPNGRKTYLPDAAFSASRYLLAKAGSDTDHIDICTADDIPIGVVTDETPVSGDLTVPLNVDLFGAATGTQIGVAAAAIAANALLVSADAGQIRTLPGVTGTYSIIGKALKAGAAQGDQVPFVPCFPIQRVVA